MFAYFYAVKFGVLVHQWTVEKLCFYKHRHPLTMVSFSIVSDVVVVENFEINLSARTTTYTINLTIMKDDLFLAKSHKRVKQRWWWQKVYLKIAENSCYKLLIHLLLFLQAQYNMLVTPWRWSWVMQKGIVAWASGLWWWIWQIGDR